MPVMICSKCRCWDHRNPCPHCGQDKYQQPSLPPSVLERAEYYKSLMGEVLEPAPISSAGMADLRARVRAAAEEPSQPSTLGPILQELARAVEKFPTWPTDPLHAVAVLNEEVGELNKAILQEIYEPGKNKPGEVRKEAIQAAAMAIRFVASLDRYEYKRSDQHTQEGTK